MPRIPILGIPIDVVSELDAIRHIAGCCRSAGQFHIATPNPEMLVEATKNEEFRKVLQNTALNIPDGAGLVWAMRKGERVTGTDLLQSITSLESRLCPPERIFLLGAAEGIAQRAAEELKRKNPAIREIDCFSGSPKQSDEADIIQRINAFNPTILFVAFGAPAQDLWIARNLPKMQSVKVAMGVGGAFDFIAGKRRRAPRWMRSMGLEWLWRLILEPRRIKRIWRAVVVFPWLVTTPSQSLSSPVSRSP